MLTATFLGIFFVPVFFVLVRSWVAGRTAKKGHGTDAIVKEAH